MQRAVVAIGVRKTGGLPELQAAQESAAAFAQWARAEQGIPAGRVKLITDAKGRVTRDRIFDAVEKIANLGFIEQLIIYFSGHGINSGLYEQWLLSRAPDDPAAAVNVRGSEVLARFCGVSHVIFVSDACRTAADSIQAQGVTGGEIFPNPKARGVENPVDQYFATLVGNPAFEVKSIADAVSSYRAAYSTVMLDALRGKAPSIVESSAGRRLIRPRPLKKHLAVAVPEYLQALNLPGGLTQQPDARIESDDTAWIAELPAAPTAAAPSSPGAASSTTAKRGRRGRQPSRRPMTGDEDLPAPAVVAAARRPDDMVLAARDNFIAELDPTAATRKRGTAREAPLGRERRPEQARTLLDRALSNSSTPFGPDHFETRCGIKVRGARLAQAWARHAAVAVGQRRDAVQVNLDVTRRGANVIVQVVDGSAVVVPVFRDYITGLTVDTEGNLDDVWCEPSSNTERYQEWQATRGDIGNLRAVIAAASSLGVFRLDDLTQGNVLLDRMRRVKGLDPAIAVYAAWAFHDRRMRSQIVDMQRHLDRDLGVRLFDVAMLAFSLGRQRATAEPGETYPCVPMLTQGWALLDPLRVTLPNQLGALRGHLRPSLWTHFEPAAVGPLVDILLTGKVE